MWYELTLKLLEQANKIKMDDSVTQSAIQLHRSGDVGYINTLLSSIARRNQIVIHHIIAVWKL